MSRHFSKRAVKNRIKEPSTWAGAAIIADVVGSGFGLPQGSVAAIVAALGGLAVVLPEQKPQDD